MMMSLKAFSKSFLRFLRRRLASPHSLQRRASMRLPRYPPLDRLPGQTLIIDVEGALLKSSSAFSYVMLVAIEAGGFLRGLVLLLLYPLLCCLSSEAALRIMVMVSFCGIRKEGCRAGRAVLPKFFLEDVGMEGFEVMSKAKRRVGVSGLPRVMVEPFLKEYLEVEVVVGRELKVIGGFYTGLMEDNNTVSEGLGLGLGLDLEEIFGGEEGVGEDVVGFGSYSNYLKGHCFSHCKEVYMVCEAEKRNWHALPRAKYPKPLVFHDGRIAFRPTPLAALAMFLWLPLGILLSIFRTLVFMFLPYKISVPIGTFTGMKSRLIVSPSTRNVQTARSHLYVCNHRTLLDPVYISAALRKHVTAVTYSVSPVSEVLSPIKTARLTRNKEEDRQRMEQLLSQGDLVVCPEGTTCREPYLMRFSPLFAELTDEIVPVALVSRVGMFYGTTASGFKFLDPFYFLMNPRPEYDVKFLDKISTTPIGGAKCSSIQLANHVQGEIGKFLGFECTVLTRKDKYLILAGNEGIVDARPKRQ